MAQGITDVLEDIDRQCDGERLTAGDVVAAFQHRGFGPLLLAPALIALLPTGAVPGVPTAIAVLIVLVAGQMIAGRSEPWLPRRLREASIESAKYHRAYEKLAPVTRRIDRLLRPRLTFLIHPPAPRLIAGLCIVLALAMSPLEIVPFAGAVPALVIVLLSLGLTAEDGALVAAGLAIAALALVVGPTWLVL